MRKTERRTITVALLILFAAIAWYAYGHTNSPGGVLLNLGNNNQTHTTYQLGITNLSAIADQKTGHVVVTFSLTNAKHFNISYVHVLYALNVADPKNATFLTINATEQNGTYKAIIPSSFNDLVYYKVQVAYDSKLLESNLQSLTVKDLTAPEFSSVTLNLTSTYDNSTNKTTYNFQITLNATDNNKIIQYTVYYADLGNATTVSNTTNFTKLTANKSIITLQNIKIGDNYAFYFTVSDPAGHTATLYNETKPLIVLANSTANWPQTYKG